MTGNMADRMGGNWGGGPSAENPHEQFKSASGNVIRALARVLSNAKAGNVAAVAIIAVSPEGVPDITFGGESELVPSVAFGCDIMKAQLINQVTRLVPQPTAPLHPVTPSIVVPDGTDGERDH